MNVLLAIDDSSCSSAAVDAVVNEFRPDRTTVQVVAAHDDVRRRAAALVADAAERLEQAGFAASTRVIEGDPRTEILAIAKEWPASAIVMGSHGRGALDRVLLGSVSLGVLRHASCSVLVVRCDPSHVDGGLSVFGRPCLLQSLHAQWRGRRVRRDAGELPVDRDGRGVMADRHQRNERDWYRQVVTIRQMGR